MEFIQSDLLPKLTKAKEYFAIKVNSESIYQDIVLEIDSLITELPYSKPKLKFFSSDIALSKQLKKISEPDLDCKQWYQLQIIPPEVKIRQILNGCEFILLVWQHQQKVSLKEQKLIKKALDRHVGLGIVVIGDRQSSIDSWLKQQVYQFPSEVIFLDRSFLVLQDSISVKQYQNALARLLPAILVKLETKLSQEIINFIDQSIKSFNNHKRQQIEAQQELYCQECEIESYRRQVSQSIQKVSKLQQNCLQELKREINHQKAILTNPFVKNNLIWQTQEIIRQAEIRIFKEETETYLVPVQIISSDAEKLYLYLADLYRLTFQEYFIQQWGNCNNVYGNGGLTRLREQIVVELEPLTHLCDVSIIPKEIALPEFQLSDLAYLPTLEAGSKMVFDYHFSDSKWFRLLVAAGLGLAIFIATKLLFGEGRFFGFLIIVFQFINLFTGQDAKTVKFKQQSKELKRTLDNKYQILIRLSADKITRDLIAAVENEQKFYQQQIEAIAKTANEKLLEIKNSIVSNRQDINRLKSDRQRILDLFRDY